MNKYNPITPVPDTGLTYHYRLHAKKSRDVSVSADYNS